MSGGRDGGPAHARHRLWRPGPAVRCDALESSGHPDPGDATWPDHVALDNETGALAAPGFNALVDTAAPGWAESPETTAAELLDLNTPFDGPIEIYLQQQTEESDSVVTVTLTRLGDDSVEARRFRVVLTRGDDGRYRFVSGEWSQRCHSGRGHRSFAASNCS
ncbi:hypothetical protein [Phytohabitans rumicis]|uniref:Uncharacterized protein n=1 Tax=Phytohabitans rumicis TaxID=1076125 RepID=A0A6V8KTS4_9ACTN|nr:hypothetical protein [Phytohabitans rumicis]GFJ86840.1 hypothetical protein Prum_004820 [Phytohabitans rumicis]